MVQTVEKTIPTMVLRSQVRIHASTFCHKYVCILYILVRVHILYIYMLPPPHVPTLCAWIVRDRRRVPANLPNLHYSSSYATHTKVLTCSFMPAPSVVSLYIYKWCSSCDQCLCYHGYTHRSYCFRNTNPANTLYFPLSYYVINTLPGTLVLWLLFTLFYTSPTCKSTCMDRWILRLFTFW